MYKEFIKRDENSMNDLKAKLIDTQDLEIPIALGRIQTSIKFVQTHILDLQTISGNQEIST